MRWIGLFLIAILSLACTVPVAPEEATAHAVPLNPSDLIGADISICRDSQVHQLYLYGAVSINRNRDDASLERFYEENPTALVIGLTYLEEKRDRWTDMVITYCIPERVK